MLDHAVASDVGRHRDHNEDRAGVAELGDGLLGVVADGMGGHAAGEVASQIAVARLTAAAADSDEPIEDRLRAAALAAHEEIQAEAVDGREGMGCTLTVAAVTPGSLRLLHIGDSRAYLLAGGELLQLTEDDTLVREMIAERVLTAEQARLHPARSVLTQALGVGEPPSFAAGSRELAGGEILLLCSDGLNSHLTDERIQFILEHTRSLASAARRLVDAANQAGGRDNITVLLVRCPGPSA